MGLEKKSESRTVLDVGVNEDIPDFSDENYEPHDHEPDGKSASYFQAFSVLMKASLGTGILGMPRAFYKAGYILGTISTIISGGLTILSVHLIARTEHELCRRKRIPRMTYPEVAEAAFEKGVFRRFKRVSRNICFYGLVLTEFGTTAAYAIAIAENLKAVCDNNFSPAPLRFYLLCLLGPLVVLCWIKNLKSLAPVTSLGTCCSIGCIGTIYYFIFSQPISLEHRKASGSFNDFALSFGTTLFALEAFPEILPIKNRMTKPGQFGSTFGVLNAAMVPNTALCVVFGVFGYLAYGKNTLSPITLNLPQTGMVGDLIRFLLGASIFMSYPIGNYVVVELLWHKNLKLRYEKIPDYWEYVFRTCVTCTNILCCIAVPNLELIMSLVGSLMVPALELWLPAIMHTITFWNEYTGIKFLIYVIGPFILCMVTGFFALVVSLSTTVFEIYQTF
ncbi:unnamed protein product [Bemisia tabaci]|uniref:Amino acid transporter transmembrane domain-containing protein n=1 Tax=Bemisia tabaci TaxID=7038 RepID=A0A9P0ADF9_BEMTA|nr:PREDICTED: proton-coupled amino acid transporter-like protein CG1139 [Bemisia tabaci]CAH0390790.1 unnamed protein product [Bemisia tabaci]